MGAKHRMDLLGVLGNGGACNVDGKFSSLLDPFVFNSAVFQKSFSWIRGGGNADLGSAPDRAGNRDMVVFPVFMGISFQYGSPAKIYGSKRVGDMGESSMDQNLSLDCGGALCHTFFMVSSVSRESV